MSPPMPRINTFFHELKKPIVEPISKIFVIAILILGVNRLPIIATTNTIFMILILTYTTLLNVSFLYFSIDHTSNSVLYITINILDCFQYLVITFLGFMLHKRLIKFYMNLNKYDEEIGISATKFGVREFMYNFLQLFITLLLCSTLYVLAGDIALSTKLLITVPVKLLNYLELHYYGHLFSLMIPRLAAMSDRMKLSYPDSKSGHSLLKTHVKDLQKEYKNTYLDMKKLMEIYNNLIITYDSLNEAVKWQMLTLIISTFTITLCLLYNIIKSTIWGSTINQGLLFISTSFMAIQLFPLLVPCVFADRVQKEVQLIKDFLACKLYENTLDKANRSTARALLALIETRNLSFSLFHMFDIDISLPFKFMALILTYLIILLQFNKVISPSKST